MTFISPRRIVAGLSAELATALARRRPPLILLLAPLVPVTPLPLRGASAAAAASVYRGRCEMHTIHRRTGRVEVESGNGVWQDTRIHKRIYRCQECWKVRTAVASGSGTTSFKSPTAVQEQRRLEDGRCSERLLGRWLRERCQQAKHTWPRVCLSLVVWGRQRGKRIFSSRRLLLSNPPDPASSSCQMAATHSTARGIVSDPSTPTSTRLLSLLRVDYSSIKVPLSLLPTLSCSFEREAYHTRSGHVKALTAVIIPAGVVERGCCSCCSVTRSAASGCRLLLSSAPAAALSPAI